MHDSTSNVKMCSAMCKDLQIVFKSWQQAIHDSKTILQMNYRFDLIKID